MSMIEQGKLVARATVIALEPLKRPYIIYLLGGIFLIFSLKSAPREEKKGDGCLLLLLSL